VRNHRFTIAIVGLSVAALVGGIALATIGGSGSTQSAGAASTGEPAAGAAPGGHTTPTVSSPATAATVRTAMAQVNGVVEVILANHRRAPLYIYKPDTATRSMVTGALAALWTPLVASAPEGSGTSGVLTAVQTENGRQVTYNGHFLYTFAEDRPGLVTGQGFQDLVVATPGLAPIHAMGTASTTLTTPTRSGSGYRY
jgi:predicted lipoprotein with Yx(FWY)xxD motif